jgi:hypothetical protein
MKSSKISSRRRNGHKANKKHENQQAKPKWQRRAKKSSKIQKAHKNQKLPLNQLPLTLSIQVLPLK